MIRIVTHLCRKVERHRKAGDALLQEVVISSVGFFSRCEAGVLPHGPQTFFVHIGVDAPGKGVLAGFFVRHMRVKSGKLSFALYFLIRLVDGFEFLFRQFLKILSQVMDLIGMELAGHAPVRLLDFLV